MDLYAALYETLLTHLPPEWVHHNALNLLEYASSRPKLLAVLRAAYGVDSFVQPVELFGLTFRNRLGIAAGLDKGGRAIPAWAALGFGFVEIGTVTPRPQPGNPAPRLFRLNTDRALINRMGFPSEGAYAVHARLQRLVGRTGKYAIPVGISLGKNKDTSLENAAQDYIAVLQTLYTDGDFFVVNISSPNTPALRQLQTPEYLTALLRDLNTARQTLARTKTPKPLLVKIAPDLTNDELDQIVAICLSQRINGIIAANTTLARDGLTAPAELINQTGGLSGAPLRARSTQIIRHIARTTGSRLPVIGVGGIFTADDAREKLDAGAVLLQAYTGFIYSGPGFARRVLLDRSYP